LDKEHFPYAFDEEDMYKLNNLEQTNYKRNEMAEPEDFGDAIKIPSQYFEWYYITRIKAMNQSSIYPGFFKNMMSGHLSIYRPDHSIKEVAFEATSPDNLFKDKIIEDNQYFTEPLTGDIISELPAYSEKYLREINITEDKMELLSNIYIITILISL
jgi:hypothetical protein